MGQGLKQRVTSEEAPKKKMASRSWAGIAQDLTPSRKGSPRKGWQRGARMWTTQNVMLMLKGGHKGRGMSYLNQMPMTEKRMVGTGCDFGTNT